MSSCAQYGDSSSSEDEDEEEMTIERVKEDAGEVRDDMLGRFAIPEKPTKRNPLIMAIYGMVCCSNRTYQSAICMSSSILIFSRV